MNILSSQSKYLWLLFYLSVRLSRFYGFYLGYYGSYFDETWRKCWNLRPIDSIKISFKKKKNLKWWRHNDIGPESYFQYIRKLTEF